MRPQYGLVVYLPTIDRELGEATCAIVAQAISTTLGLTGGRIAVAPMTLSGEIN